MSADCIFCKIIEGKIPSKKLYEDDDVLVFNDINPLAKVHFLIIPKQHIESLASCTEENVRLLSKITLLAPKLAAEQGLTGFRTMINTGKSGGQEVFHLHYHVYGGSEHLPKT
jgi:histidine triad (HIT) family protein